MSAPNQRVGSVNPANVIQAEPMEFSFNTKQKEVETVQKEVMFDGKIIEMYIGAAAAVNNQVGIQFNYGGDQYVPGNKEDDYIYPADVTRGWPVVFPVEGKDPITLQYRNFAGSQHYLNIMLMLVQFEGDTGGGR